MSERRIKIPATVAAFTGIILGFITFASTNLNETQFRSENSTDELRMRNRSIGVYDSVHPKLWNINSYCEIQECKVINCRDISEGRNVGAIVSNFISSIFKMECPRETQIASLKLKNCSFSGGKLQSFWLVTEYSVIDLIFEDCLLTNIEENAFSPLPFGATKRFAIINTSLRKLNKAIFDRFHNLLSLTIRNNLLEEVEFNLLENVADTLQNIELNGAIRDEKVLKNITNGSELSNVELISMQENNISHLSSEILEAFPNARSIYLDSSQIKNIEANALEPLKSIEQIFLSNNFLSTLQKSTFNTVLSRNSNVRIMISGNPWNCNCTLEWIQKVIRQRPNFLVSIPECRTPDRNMGLNFLEADFCNGSESAESPASMEKTCQRLLNNENQSSPSKDVQLSAKIPGFYIKEYLKNDSVFVHLEAYQNPRALIWFRNSDKNSGIECAIAGNKSIILQNIRKNSVYTLCILDIIKGLSPLNCLAMSPLLAPNRVWLETADKPVTIIVILSVVGLSFVVGGVVSFFVVLKNPHLIRASHRVIMVKRGQVGAMILPKGVLWLESPGEEEESRKARANRRPEYLIPISDRRNLKFQENYYDSIKKNPHNYRGIDGRPHSLSPFGNSIKSSGSSRRFSNYDVPPPLPPYPKTNVLKTLSQAVESRIESRIVES